MYNLRVLYIREVNMKTENMKCPKCGYKFQGNSQDPKGTCPLCSEEYDTEKALEYYRMTCGNGDSDNNTKSKPKIIRDWIIFGIVFAAFIIIMQYMINFIINA